MENLSKIDLDSYVAGARMMLLRLISNGVLDSTPKIYGENEKLTLKQRKRFVDASLVATLLRDGEFLSAFLLEKPITVEETSERSGHWGIKTIKYHINEE
jgi:hypothetical protein